jgi:hypothetical protein
MLMDGDKNPELMPLLMGGMPAMGLLPALGDIDRPDGDTPEEPVPREPCGLPEDLEPIRAGGKKHKKKAKVAESQGDGEMADAPRAASETKAPCAPNECIFCSHHTL